MEVKIILNLCGVEQRTVLFERVIVGSLLSLQLHCVLTQRHLVDGLLRFLTTAHGGEGENDGDDTFAHNGL